MFRFVNISNAARSIEPEGAAKGCHYHGKANQDHFEHGSTVHAAVSVMIVRNVCSHFEKPTDYLDYLVRYGGMLSLF